MKNRLQVAIFVFLLSTAADGGQQWPFLFDVNLAEKPAEVAQMIAERLEIELSTRSQSLEYQDKERKDALNN